MEVDWQKIEMILPQVSRPGRYIGNELHAVKKDEESVLVRIALAFPDVYEIGMSHVGMEILYHVLNRVDWVAAERVYSPWIDMEEKMRESDIPLFSLESRKPVSLFDILGITLQYELHYTNIVNLLDLAHIPIWAKDRGEKDPLVVAGGPCAFNPEPLAEFLDAVVLGDGEEVVVEIAETIREAKRERWSRKVTLERLSRLDGVYVPSFYRTEYDSDGAFRRILPTRDEGNGEVRARILDKLTNDHYPTKPLVPMIEVTHDRFSMEIMRGCTRGCRFCNAGMIYRPVRERAVDDLIKHAQAVVSNTGYDEMALVSLSTSDYRNLSDLLCRLKDTFQGEGVSISFPSLRPETLTPEIADYAQGLRRSGLTLAPEAGSQRLRNVINKNNRDEDLFNALDIAFQRGWRQIKLYFMIGLPTETQEDLQAMVDLIGRVVSVCKRYGKKEIHVSISPFCPKPQTPFQWVAQDGLDVMEEKITFLKKKITWNEVKLSYRDPRVSQLEAILGRGDRRMAEVIYHAWKEGARFDAWSDHFDYDRWVNALGQEGLSVEASTGVRDMDVPLPWDHLSKGVSKSYLVQEWKRALAQQLNEDCRVDGCKGCGLMDQPVCRNIITYGGKNRESGIQQTKSLAYGRRIKRYHSNDFKRRVRVGYSKRDPVRYTSHLDLVRIFTRALRRARIPVALTQGYHAHLKIATGPPLAMGFTSRAEYLDLELNDRLPSDLKGLMNHYLPDGIRLFQSKVLLGKLPSLNESITLASYVIDADWPFGIKDMKTLVADLLMKNACRVRRIKKGQEIELDIRPFITTLSLDGKSLRLVLRLTSRGTARVEEVVRALFPPFEEVPTVLWVERTGLYVENQGSRMTPMDVV